MEKALKPYINGAETDVEPFALPRYNFSFIGIGVLGTT